MFIDFHTHFLHGIDDGASDLRTGVKMLEASHRQGTECVVATPHFHLEDTTISDACSMRDSAMAELIAYTQKRNIHIPDIVCGFEVDFNNALKDQKELKNLCIQGTDYMLIEMPYTDWNEQLYECLYNLTLAGVKPVIAHVDRYYRHVGEAVYRLLELDVSLQFNCDVMNTISGRNFVKQLMDTGRACVIGTDMHNMISRPCNISKSHKKSMQKLPMYTHDLFYANAHKLLFEN